MARSSEIDAHLADLADLAARLKVDFSKDYRLNGPRGQGRAELRRGGSRVTASLADAFGLDHPFIVIDNPARPFHDLTHALASASPL